MIAQSCFAALRVGCGIAVLLTSSPVPVHAAETPVIRQAGVVTFRTVPNVPKCVVATVERGNPMRGPSVIFARVKPGCVIPWHWHPFNETLLTSGGAIENEVKDEQVYVSHSGDYLFLPAHHPHRAICRGPETCLTFLISEGNSNAHYIDISGRDISLPEALKRSGHPPRT